MSFRLVPKSVTFNDLERRNDPYLEFFSPNSAALRQKCSPKHLVLAMCHLWWYDKHDIDSLESLEYHSNFHLYFLLTGVFRVFALARRRRCRKYVTDFLTLIVACTFARCHNFIIMYIYIDISLWMIGTIISVYELSIDTKIGDLERRWTAKWPIFCVFSLNSAAFRAHCAK